jgi:hypothetical protein
MNGLAQDISVIEVDSGHLLNKFIKLPFKLYRGDPNWVPPLITERKEFFDKRKNPFYRGARTQLFLAVRDNRPVGRIATCINYNHNEYHGEKAGFFGFFECVDDYEVAAKLFKVAMITLKSEGMEKMRGPANFSTNHEVGFLVEGYDSPPAIMQPYNKPYLPLLAEKFGLKKVMDLHAYLITEDIPIPERQLRVVEKIRQRNDIKIRPVDFSRFNDEIKVVRYIYNHAWERNWGFVPMGEEEFNYMGRSLKQLADPELILIAEMNNEPAGFLMAIPNINEILIKLNGRLLPIGIFRLLWGTKIRRGIRGLRVMTMGVVDKFRRRGIDNVMFVDVYKRGVQKGYKWAELSWVLETNDLMCRAAQNMNAILYKKYRMVEMPI